MAELEPLCKMVADDFEWGSPTSSPSYDGILEGFAGLMNLRQGEERGRFSRVRESRSVDLHVQRGQRDRLTDHLSKRGGRCRGGSSGERSPRNAGPGGGTGVDSGCRRRSGWRSGSGSACSRVPKRLRSGPRASKARQRSGEHAGTGEVHGWTLSSTRRLVHGLAEGGTEAGRSGGLRRGLKGACGARAWSRGVQPAGFGPKQSIGSQICPITRLASQPQEGRS